jgi:hypothetical protein
VNGATISAYQLNTALARGSLLAQAATAADGSFSLTLPVYSGMIEVVATGGTYPEEARRDVKGDPIPLSMTAELTTVIPSFSAGGTATVTITPFSTVARWLAKKGATTTDAGTAIASAWTCVNNHFGGGAIDWRTVVPVNFALPHGQTLTPAPSTSDPAVKAGLLLAALSQAATTMAADTSVTGATLAAALAEDAKDGVLDGKLNGGALAAGATGTPALDSYLTRRVLAQAVLDFISKGANPAPTQLTTTALYPLADALASDSSTCLFPSGDAPLPLTVMPPALTFTDAAGNPIPVPKPLYTNSADSKVTLYFTATDPLAQVTEVHAQSGNVDTPGTLSNGVWTIVGVPLNPNSLNTVYVWGKDALGAGSITGSGTLVVPVIHDSLPPTFYPDVNTTIAYDESALSFNTPLTVPPTYSFPAGATKRPVSATSPVFKASTRLAPTGAITPQILETTNLENVPFLRVSVPVSSSSAPITAVGYSISDGVHTYGGSLLAPPPSTDPSWLSTVTADSAFFDLPLTSLTVPSLATTTASPVQLDVSFIATDAAGNCSGYLPVASIKFNVVAPPVSVSRDDNYSLYGDPHGVYPYYLSNRSYSTLIGDSTKFLGGNVRLVRYLVTNPTSVPVVVRTTVTGQSTATDIYSRSLGGKMDDGTGTFTVDGDTLNSQIWVSNNGALVAGCAQTASATHWVGDPKPFYCVTDMTLDPWGSLPVGSPGPTTSPTWSSAVAVTSVPFANPTSNATEVASPVMAGGFPGFPVVPPASGGTPGQIAIYLARPWSSHTLNPNAYTGWMEGLVYWYVQLISGGCCGFRVYDLHAINSVLSGASETLNGTVTMTTQGVVGTALAGQPSPSPAFSDGFSNVVLTTH